MGGASAFSVADAEERLTSPIRMQSTTNYLWLISDLLGQGATANVYRGRHKVGEERGRGLITGVNGWS